MHHKLYAILLVEEFILYTNKKVPSSSVVLALHVKQKTRNLIRTLFFFIFIIIDCDTTLYIHPGRVLHICLLHRLWLFFFFFFFFFFFERVNMG